MNNFVSLLKKYYIEGNKTKCIIRKALKINFINQILTLPNILQMKPSDARNSIVKGEKNQHDHSSGEHR